MGRFSVRESVANQAPAKNSSISDYSGGNELDIAVFIDDGPESPRRILENSRSYERILDLDG